jgi:hypothetical protein
MLFSIWSLVLSSDVGVRTVGGNPKTARYATDAGAARYTQTTTISPFKGFISIVVSSSSEASVWH